MRRLIVLAALCVVLVSGCGFFQGVGEFFSGEPAQERTEQVAEDLISGNWAGAIVGGVGLLVGALGAGMGIKAKRKAKAKK